MSEQQPITDAQSALVDVALMRIAGQRMKTYQVRKASPQPKA